MWKNKHLPYIYSSLYSSLYLFIQNTYIYSSSRFNFNHTTIISISFCIRVPNFVQIQQPVADLVGFSGAILLLVSDWVMSTFQKVKVYRQTKLCWDNSIHSWDITISGLEKNWVGGIPTKDSDGRRNPGSKTRDRQTLVNRFHPIFRWWATSMMQSCMPNFKMKFSGLRFYRGSNFRFSYDFLQGAYNSAMLVHCRWWTIQYCCFQLVPLKLDASYTGCRSDSI